MSINNTSTVPSVDIFGNVIPSIQTNSAPNVVPSMVAGSSQQNFTAIQTKSQDSFGAQFLSKSVGIIGWIAGAGLGYFAGKYIVIMLFSLFH